jgi:F0F1-type ATP synthase membrane subunit c/vacuolar-type H+-ATPase subunit K
MKRIASILTIFFICTLCLFLFRTNSQAQFQSRTFNLAITPEIKDEETEDGDIVSMSEEQNGLIRSIIAYDEKMYGVAVKNPIMVYRTRDSIPITRVGVAYVNVTDLGGQIKIGDFITSSMISGKGQKAGKLNGYILGIALTGFDGKDGEQLDFEGKTYKRGKVYATVGIGPASPVQIKASGGLFGTLKFMMMSLLFNLRSNEDSWKWLRYLIAAFVAITTMIINYRTFGKNITKGIESIGRNPLAKASIQSMIVLNVIMISIVSIGGIILALAIISL